MGRKAKRHELTEKLFSLIECSNEMPDAYQRIGEYIKKGAHLGFYKYYGSMPIWNAVYFRCNLEIIKLLYKYGGNGFNKDKYVKKRIHNVSVTRYITIPYNFEWIFSESFFMFYYNIIDLYMYHVNIEFAKERIKYLRDCLKILNIKEIDIDFEKYYKYGCFN
jgi:hypothetical protein